MEDKGLQAIKVRLAAVTKGVWEVGVVREERSQTTVWFNNESHAEVMNGNYLNNAKFIAQAPQDMADLIAEVERLYELIVKERKEHLLKVFEVIGDADKKLVEENEWLRKALEKIEKKTSDKSVKTIVQVTLDPTKYERHKSPGDPF